MVASHVTCGLHAKRLNSEPKMFLVLRPACLEQGQMQARDDRVKKGPIDPFRLPLTVPANYLQMLVGQHSAQLRGCSCFARIRSTIAVRKSVVALLSSTACLW